MPTLTSTQYDEQVAAAANFANRIDDKRQIAGAVQYATIEVPITANNDAADVITLLDLPVGAIVLPELSKVLVSDDCTSGAFTIDIGDSTDVDRYAAGINVASVGIVEFCSVLSGTVPAGLHVPHKVTDATNTVIMTLVTMAATIEAGEIIVVLAYKCL